MNTIIDPMSISCTKMAHLTHIHVTLVSYIHVTLVSCCFHQLHFS